MFCINRHDLDCYDKIDLQSGTSALRYCKLHDNTVFILPVESPCDVVCPQNHPTPIPYLFSSRPAVQLHDQDT